MMQAAVLTLSITRILAVRTTTLSTDKAIRPIKLLSKKYSHTGKVSQMTTLSKVNSIRLWLQHRPKERRKSPKSLHHDLSQPPEDQSLKSHKQVAPTAVLEQSPRDPPARTKYPIQRPEPSHSLQMR